MKTLSLAFTLILLYPSFLSAEMIKGAVLSRGSAPQTITWQQIVNRKPARHSSIQEIPYMSLAREKTQLPSSPALKKSFPPSASAFSSRDWTGFAGDDYATNGWLPPDSNGAIGPDHFMEVINGAVNIYSRNGTILNSATLTAFFSFSYDAVSYPRDYGFDPRVIYDHRSERWFTTCLEYNNRAENHVLLAVSRNSDPTGTWDRYVIPVGVPSIGINDFFSDFETLAVDDNGVYIGIYIFPLTSSAYGKIIATSKASLIADSPSLDTVFEWTNITDMYSTPQPAFNHDTINDSARAWFISSSTTIYGNIHYRRLIWNTGIPTLDSSSSILSTPPYGEVVSAPALGSTTNVHSGDDRIQMAMISNNRLWTARNVGINSSGGSSSTDRTGCEWFEIDVSSATPSVIQNGRIYDSGTSDPRFYYYPSIAGNTTGTAVVGFSGSNSSEYIGAYVTSRSPDDPSGTMGPVILLQEGLAPYTIRDSRGRNRWGDYSYTSIDPLDNNSFWTIQEYAKDTNNWGMYIARTQSSPAASPWAIFLPAVLNSTVERKKQ